MMGVTVNCNRLEISVVENFGLVKYGNDELLLYNCYNLNLYAITKIKRSYFTEVTLQ